MTNMTEGAERIAQQLRSDAQLTDVRAKDISNHSNPTLSWLDEQCNRAALDIAGVCRRAFDRGPIAAFIRDANAIKVSHGRPYTLRGFARRACAEASDEQTAQKTAERIDDLRFLDTKRAAAEARKALRSMSGPPLAPILGALASVHWMMCRLDWASVELGEALKLAEVTERHDLVADLARRASCVLRDRGNLDGAEALGREALSLCESQGDEVGATYCMIELSVTLLKQGQHREACRRLEAAAELKMDQQRYRYAALHNLAFGQLSLGDLEAAEPTATKAARCLPDGALTAGYLSWLRAGIAYQKKSFPRAESLYARAYSAIAEPAANRLLIGAEWVRTMLAMGRMREATETAERLLQLHHALETDSLDTRRPLSSAAMRLALAGRRAEISADLVDATLREIVEGHRARRARLRARLHP